ncbi:lipid-A-disaccharide synthase [bacterium]|nr:lipid-A-disaccharide synthase [bacterium]
MRIFFSVGEPSGDLHGANLIRRMKTEMPNADFVGYGGPKMVDAGCDVHYDLTQQAVMFLWDVIKQLRFFFGLVDRADEYFAENEVDAVVLIDYPGFNWWIAKKAKQRGIPVFYYGVPQMWAWAPWRVRKIRKYVDHVLCKLPFEVEWFKQRDCHATYVGHPYFDQLQRQSYDGMFLQKIKSEGLVTLLPGSRDREVKNNLPTLVTAVEHVAQACPQAQFAVACFNQKQKEMAEEILEDHRQSRDVDQPALPKIQLFVDRTPELMVAATACMACSGSVSMELLHHRKPTVIVYKVKRWIMAAQAILLRTKFITLVNLIAADDIRKKTWAPFDPERHPDEAIMPEYMSTGDVSKEVANHVVTWLKDEDRRQQKVAQLDSVAEKYAIAGATSRAADYMISKLREPSSVSKAA